MKRLSLDSLEAPLAKADLADAETQRIRFTDWTRADRAKRQIIEAIEGIEDPDMVPEYVRREDLVIDALHLFDPTMAADIRVAAAEHRASLILGANPYARISAHPSPAAPGTKPKGKPMAANSDFKKIMVEDVDFLWPRLDQPYRFDPVAKRTEPCAASATNAGYSISWSMSAEAARTFRDELLQHYNTVKAGKPKLPEFKKVFGAKKDENGVITFTARKRAMSQAGKENKPPIVVGPDLQTLEDKTIWSGSKGSLRLLAFPTTDPDGIGGISLLLDAVQVVEAVYGGDSLEDDFGPAKRASLDDVADAPAAQPQTAQPAMADDDIGF